VKRGSAIEQGNNQLQKEQSARKAIVITNHAPLSHLSNCIKCLSPNDEMSIGTSTMRKSNEN
jgi:hypothetical protein